MNFCVVAPDNVLRQMSRVLGVEKLLHRLLVALSYPLFKLISRCPKAGATHQMRHQLDIFSADHLITA